MTRVHDESADGHAYAWSLLVVLQFFAVEQTSEPRGFCKIRVSPALSEA